EIAVVPLDGDVGPRALDPARHRVDALPGTAGVVPPEALRLDRTTLGFGTDEVGAVRAVTLAEGVTADDECSSLLVVHGHPRKRLTNVDSCGQRVRVAVRSLGVHVDQTHLHGAERVRKVAHAAVALVAEPGVFGAPEDLVGFPDVGTAESEAERL